MTKRESMDKEENVLDTFDKSDEDDQFFLESTQNASDELESDEKYNKYRKFIIRFFAFLISFIFIITILGNIFSDLNIYSIKFLVKSYELSKDAKIKEWKESVAMVSTELSSGTGFNISQSGDIITNSHVVKEATNIHINFPLISSFKAKKWEAFPEVDLAIIKIDNSSKIPFLNLETNKEPKTGDKVTVIGNPMRFFNVVSIGRVMGYTTLPNWNIPILKIKVPIYKGSSGSPVINENGNVIGVIFATSAFSNTDEKDIIGFAIPSKEILLRVK